MAAYTAAKSGVVNARSPDVRIMTFGQPRVGDTAFSFDFSSYYPRAMRIVYGGDPVPHVPFCAMGWNWHYERSWVRRRFFAPQPGVASRSPPFPPTRCAALPGGPRRGVPLPDAGVLPRSDARPV